MAQVATVFASFDIGEIHIQPVADGVAKIPVGSFLGLDWTDHAALLAADGRYHVPVGSFVVRSGERVIVVDAGLGDPGDPALSAVFDCGYLPRALVDAGVDAAEVDTVICSHLHLDHAGGLVRDGRPLFPNAVVRCTAADWDHFVVGGEGPDYVRDGLRQLEQLDRIEILDPAGEAIAPGVQTVDAAGHTPGHQVVVLSSGDDRALLLGDSVVCPLQIDPGGWAIGSDIDADGARRTRERLLAEAEGSRAALVGPHFPGMVAGRLVMGSRGRLFV